MTTEPWGASSRPAQMRVRQAATSKTAPVAVTAMVVTLIFAVASYVKYTAERSWETARVPTSAYAQVTALAKSCPALRPSIRAAMQDGYITRGEARALQEAAERRQTAYNEANARRIAAAAVGAPAVSAPAPCAAVAIPVIAQDR